MLKTDFLHLFCLPAFRVRRGYEVYKQVCAACHSMQYIRYRHFINHFMSEVDAKKEASEAQIDDIDDKGEQIKVNC